MRDQDGEARALEGGYEAVQGGVELDGSDQGEGFAGGEVAGEGREEVRRVDADVDEDVQRFDLRHVDGDEAAVGVVHEEVAAECPRRVVVDAACAVGDVAHDEGFGARAEAREDVGDGGGEEEEAFGELERDFLRRRAADAVDGFGDFEAVVCREEGDCGEDVWVVGD